MACVVGNSGSSVGTDGMKSIWRVYTILTRRFVRVLDLRKSSAAIVLGPTSSLLVAKGLTGSRCEKPCDRAVSLQKRLRRFYATDQRALHFQHSDASLMDCPGPEICPQCQP